MLQQMEHLRETAETLQAENTRLGGDLASAQSRSRRAHNQVAEELTRALAAQHAAMAALRRLEQYCRSHGLTMRDANLVSYEVGLALICFLFFHAFVLHRILIFGDFVAFHFRVLFAVYI